VDRGLQVQLEEDEEGSTGRRSWMETSGVYSPLVNENKKLTIRGHLSDNATFFSLFDAGNMWPLVIFACYLFVHFNFLQT